jgi:sigma-E factor negative regulatory protein RseB
VVNIQPSSTPFRGPNHRRWAAVGSLLLALWQPVQGQVTATVPAQPPQRSITEWLTRLHEASRQRAYTGTLVVSNGAEMSTARIWHICDGVQQMERVENLTGSRRSTIRHNSDVITFAPENKVAWTDRRESLGIFPALLRAPNNAIPEYYSVRDGETERVADHLADVVDLVPRDKLRFGYRIWAEKRTGLVIKLQTLNEQGAVLEQAAFSELQLDAPVRMDKLKRQMADTKGFEVFRQVLNKTTPEAEGWQLNETVPGFQSMSCHIREADASLPMGDRPLQWVFSDGLASVSLFVEPFDARRHRTEGMAITGASHSITRRVGTYWITALGEVPPATLRRFVQALERRR